MAKLCRVHPVLLVDEWTALGAHCTCTVCKRTMHMSSDVLARDYLDFEHRSGSEGPSGDIAIFLHKGEL